MRNFRKCKNIHSSNQGFALAWMITLLSAIGIFFAFAVGYVHLEARRSKRELEQDVLRRTICFKVETYLNLLNAKLGSDCCAMALANSTTTKGLIYSTNHREWRLLENIFHSNPIRYYLGKHMYDVQSTVTVTPDYLHSLTVQSNSKNGGLKADLNTLLNEPIYSQYRSKQLWEGGLSWEILHDYMHYLEKHKHHPQLAKMNPLGTELNGDGWKNLFAAWRGFTSKKHTGLGPLKKILISPIIRKVSLGIGFSVSPSELSNGLHYRINDVSLFPSILIHNPYDVSLELEQLNCVWNLNLKLHLKSSIKNTFLEDELPMLDVRKLLAQNNNGLEEGLVMEIPYMQLKPGEMRWLYMGKMNESKPSTIKMQTEISPGAGVRLNCPNNILPQFPADAFFSMAIGTNAWSQLKLIDPKNKTLFWRAENIIMNNNPKNIVLGYIASWPKGSHALAEYSCSYLSIQNNVRPIAFNDCGMSISPTSWESSFQAPVGKNAISKPMHKICMHLPILGITSLGDLVHLPFVPLDILPKYQLGSASDNVSLSQPRLSTSLPSQLPILFNITRKLNEALWDSYWVCSEELKHAGVIIPIPHGLLKSKKENNAINTANSIYTPAEHYWIKGGFNINCTDPTQWERFLSKHLPWELPTIQKFSKILAECNQQQGPQRTLYEWISGAYPPEGKATATLQAAINKMQLLNAQGAPLNQAEVIARIAPYMTIRWDTLHLDIDVTCNTKNAPYLHYQAGATFQRFPTQWNNLNKNIKKDSGQSLVPSRKWKIMSFNLREKSLKAVKLPSKD